MGTISEESEPTHSMSRPLDEFIGKRRKTLTVRSLAEGSTRTRWRHPSQEGHWGYSYWASERRNCRRGVSILFPPHLQCQPRLRRAKNSLGRLKNKYSDVQDNSRSNAEADTDDRSDRAKNPQRAGKQLPLQERARSPSSRALTRTTTGGKRKKTISPSRPSTTSASMWAVIARVANQMTTKSNLVQTTAMNMMLSRKTATMSTQTYMSKPATRNRHPNQKRDTGSKKFSVNMVKVNLNQRTGGSGNFR